MGIRQSNFMLQPQDSSKLVPISCSPTGMPIILAVTVLWPLSHPDFFVIALAEQCGLILPSTCGLQSSSMGERPQHCLAAKGHSTWFCPVIRNASRTVPPHKPVCRAYFPSQDLVDAIQHVKNGRWLRSI